MHLFLLGAGHVGLVTAVGFARLGHRVTVADLDAARIAAAQRRPAADLRTGSDRGARRRVSRTDRSPSRRSSIRPPTRRSPSSASARRPGPDGPLSTVHVEAAIERLLDTGRARSHDRRPVHAARSTDRAASRRSPRRTPIRPSIVTNPEFMREGQALEDFDRPNRVVTGWLEPRDQAAAEAVLDSLRAAWRPVARRRRPVGRADQARLERLPRDEDLVRQRARPRRRRDRVPTSTRSIAGIGLDARIGTAFLQPGPGDRRILPARAGRGDRARDGGARRRGAAALGDPSLNAVHQRQIVAAPGTPARRTGLARRPPDRPARPGVQGQHRRRPRVAGPRARGEPAGRRGATCSRTIRGPRPAPAWPTRCSRVAATPIEAVHDADAVVVATEWRGLRRRSTGSRSRPRCAARSSTTPGP